MRMLLLISMLWCFAASAGEHVKSKVKPVEVSPEARKVLNDVQNTFGMVPTFFKHFPEEGLEGAWMEFKSLEANPNTALPAKYKELIGLGVAAQIPCKHCLIVHTEFAKLNGATDREIREALGVAAIVRHWSTFLNGMQTDEASFRSDVKQMLDFMKNGAKAENAADSKVRDNAATANATPSKAEATYADIRSTCGVVPGFLRAFPEESVAGAWKELKNLQMNPKTAIPSKYKELIGLGIAAQIPCHYCAFFHTEIARANGATDQEIAEAVAMSALTRHWSTFMNGMQYDDKDTRREVAQLVALVKKKMAKEKGTTTSQREGAADTFSQ